MIWKGTTPIDSNDGGSVMGMSFVVIIVGEATFAPA